MKSEPGAFSIEDLRRVGVEHWDGVRNYQARNLMRDQMTVGDRVLFYHSSVDPPGVAGLAEVASAAYPDHTSWDPESPSFDPASTPAVPRWFMVDVRWVETFPRLVTLDELRARAELEGMVLLTRSRLSVQPVTPEQFTFIVALAHPNPRRRRGGGRHDGA
jgi:predicted RNA-binding protein with PUA-like domain